MLHRIIWDVRLCSSGRWVLRSCRFGGDWGAGQIQIGRLEFSREGWWLYVEREDGYIVLAVRIVLI